MGYPNPYQPPKPVIYTSDNTLPPFPHIGDVSIPWHQPSPVIYTSGTSTGKPDWPNLYTRHKMPFGTFTYFAWLDMSFRIFGACGAVVCCDKCDSSDYLVVECWQINDGVTYTWNSCKCRHTQWYDMSSSKMIWTLPETECFQCLVSTVESVVNVMLGGPSNGGRAQVLPV
jgi:hypothetical protein